MAPKDSQAELHPLEWVNNCPRKMKECPESLRLQPPLLLVSLDGFRGDYLDRGFTPTLERIGRCGVRAESLFPVFPSKTFPNHYTQVTGLYPASHGIVDNFMFDPSGNRTFKLGKRSTLDSFWWQAEPIWLTAEKQGKRSATFFWPGSDVIMNGSRPTYYRNYSSDVPFEARVDQVLEWLSLPEALRPSFLTLYLNEPDSAAHHHGTQSEQTNAALSRVDGIVERLFRGLQEKGLADCVNILILSDHGMSNIDCSRTIALQQYINISSIEAILGPFGRIRLKNNTEKVEDLMSTLRCQSDQLRVYRKEQLPVRMHYADSPRIEPIFLDIDSEWTVVSTDVAAGDWVCTGGAHGYDNFFPDMRAFFVALGPSLKKNLTIRPFLSVELYELMCELLDIVPNPNNGTRGSLHHLLERPRAPLFSEPKTLLVPAEVPEDLEEYDERVEAARCPCTQSHRQELIEDLQRYHSPLGMPYSAENYLILQNRDYVLAYSTSYKIPVWTSFTLRSQNPAERSDVCWTGDARIPLNATIRCTDFNTDILQRPLYPPVFSQAATRSEAFLVTNSIAKSLNHTGTLEGEMNRILGRWSTESVQLNVAMGPAFDFFGSGLKPTEEDFEIKQSAHACLLVPTHIFVVATWCSESGQTIADCHPSQLDVHSFLLPNNPYPENCQTAIQIIEKNSARVVDIEKLTGLTFFSDLPPYGALRLRTSVPQRRLKVSFASNGSPALMYK